MGGWFMFTVTAVSALCGLSLSCSSCKFEWMEYGNYCYRYFPQHLSYDEAEMFCKQFSHNGHVAELATVTSPEELTFIVDYLDKMFTNVPSGEVPIKVWLRNKTEIVPDVDPILHRILGPMESHVGPCDSVAVSGDWFQLAGNQDLIKIVPAPDVVDHACAVYSKAGSYLNLGDFKETCISDPGFCESMTWSLWLKIDTSSGFSDPKYYISSGGQTILARGIAFLYQNNVFQYIIKPLNSGYRLFYASSKIPQNKWFHLTLAFDGVSFGNATQLFVDGVLVASDSHDMRMAALSDGCTQLYLGNANTCNSGSLAYSSSAAYSDLTVFDGLLTEQEIQKMYSCGSHEWYLMVRSLVMRSDLEYECTASDTSGPTITWSLYHKQTGSWENLDASGDGYTIHSVTVSTCVVRSTLVMSSSQVGPMAIACTAQAGPNNASVFIYKGNNVTFSFSDQKSTGISLLAEGSLVNYTYKYSFQQSGSITMEDPKYPFVCKIPDRIH